MLSPICFRQIRDNFYFGQYGNFNVVIDKSNGFVNATKLCADGGKKFCHWNETKVSKELINTLQQYNFNIALDDDQTQEPWSIANYSPVGEVTRYIHTLNVSEDDKAISGTYCHPLLIPHIACWVSPQFALKAASIINFFIVEEWRCRLQAAEMIYQQRTQLLEHQNHALTDHNMVLEGTVNEWCNAANEKLEMVEVKKETINALEDQMTNKIKVQQKWASTHAFCLLRVNDGENYLPYYAIRCQRRAMSSTITKLRRRHPRAEVLYHQNKIPNSINLFTRLREGSIVKTKRNYCMLLSYDEKEFLNQIQSLCGIAHPPLNVAPLNVYMQRDNN